MNTAVVCVCICVCASWDRGHSRVRRGGGWCGRALKRRGSRSHWVHSLLDLCPLLSITPRLPKSSCPPTLFCDQLLFEIVVCVLT